MKKNRAYNKKGHSKNWTRLFHELLTFFWHLSAWIVISNTLKGITNILNLYKTLVVFLPFQNAILNFRSLLHTWGNLGIIRGREKTSCNMLGARAQMTSRNGVLLRRHVQFVTFSSTGQSLSKSLILPSRSTNPKIWQEVWRGFTWIEYVLFKIRGSNSSLRVKKIKFQQFYIENLKMKKELTILTCQFGDLNKRLLTNLWTLS